MTGGSIKQIFLVSPNATHRLVINTTSRVDDPVIVGAAGKSVPWAIESVVQLVWSQFVVWLEEKGVAANKKLTFVLHPDGALEGESYELAVALACALGHSGTEKGWREAILASSGAGSLDEDLTGAIALNQKLSHFLNSEWGEPKPVFFCASQDVNQLESSDCQAVGVGSLRDFFDRLLEKGFMDIGRRDAEAGSKSLADVDSRENGGNKKLWLVLFTGVALIGLCAYFFHCRLFNEPPMAVNDYVKGDEDTVIKGNVLVNDSDDDFESLEVVAGRYETREGNQVVFSNDGSFEVELTKNFNGADRITYSVVDACGVRSEGLLDFEVLSVNDPPIVKNSIFSRAAADLPYQLQLEASDPDGDSLFFRKGNVKDGLGEYVRVRGDGRVTVDLPSWFYGNFEFLYVVSDGLVDAHGQLKIQIEPIEIVVSLTGPGSKDRAVLHWFEKSISERISNYYDRSSEIVIVGVSQFKVRGLLWHEVVESVTEKVALIDCSRTALRYARGVYLLSVTPKGDIVELKMRTRNVEGC